MWDKNKKETNKIWTEVLPEYTIYQMIPNTTEINKYRKMEFLANSDKESIYKELQELPKEYNNWLKEQQEDESLSEREKNILNQNIQKAKEVNNRIVNTIDMFISTK